MRARVKTVSPGHDMAETERTRDVATFSKTQNDSGGEKSTVIVLKGLKRCHNAKSKDLKRDPQPGSNPLKNVI